MRELTTKDEELIFALDSDPEVMKYLTDGVATPRDEVRMALKLGSLIMKRIMEFVERECHGCTFVSLFADVGFLYQKFGFVDSVKSQGMYLDWSKVKPRENPR